MTSDVKKKRFCLIGCFIARFFVFYCFLLKSLDFPTPERGVLLLAYRNVGF